MKFTDEDLSAVQSADSLSIDRSQGAARAISVRQFIPHRQSFRISNAPYQSFINPGLQWSDINWFRSITKSMCSLLASKPISILLRFSVPLILKGVQRWEVGLRPMTFKKRRFMTLYRMLSKPMILVSLVLSYQITVVDSSILPVLELRFSQRWLQDSRHEELAFQTTSSSSSQMEVSDVPPMFSRPLLLVLLQESV